MITISKERGIVLRRMMWDIIKENEIDEHECILCSSSCPAFNTKQVCDVCQLAQVVLGSEIIQKVAESHKRAEAND